MSYSDKVPARRVSSILPETRRKPSPIFRFNSLTNNVFLAQPPDNPDSFAGLFRHAWDRGIGNQTENGRPIPWTVERMEAAFDTLQRPVSTKSIENWRRGASRPSRRNLVILAEIFSNGQPRLRQDWMDALFNAPQDSGHKNQKLDAKPAAEAKDPKIESAPNPTSDLAHADPKPPTHPPVKRLAVIGGAILAVGLLAAWVTKPRTSAPVVTDMRFCLESEFDRTSLRCTVDRDIFPANVPIVYVSFEADPPYGTPFERRWYRDGVEFLRRDGFFDEAWENWTWLGPEDGLEPGRYVMRVIIDGRTATHGFTIEPPTKPAQ